MPLIPFFAKYCAYCGTTSKLRVLEDKNYNYDINIATILIEILILRKKQKYPDYIITRFY